MEKLKNFLNGFIFNLFINILVIFSIALLFLTRLVPFEKDVIQVLDTVDVIVLTVFSLEFILKLLLFGGRYFVREFGWIDLLSCIPVLTPIFRSFTQFKALRIARMIRFIRIIRVMRLFKSMQGKAQGKAEQNIGIRTNFFLSVASITMLFILATAITITVFIEGFIDSQRNLEMQFLINSLTDANIPQVVQHNLILGITVKREEGMSHYGLPVDTMERALTEDDFFVFP
ncbi:MAG TPA: ion transporter, partial [Spirochaetia bacterium]|nr:ion transporter [Spirochaetia bacterium]